MPMALVEPQKWEDAKRRMKSSGLKVDKFNQALLDKVGKLIKEWDAYKGLLANKQSVDPFVLDGTRQKLHANIKAIGVIAAGYERTALAMKNLQPKPNATQLKLIGDAQGVLIHLMNGLNARAKEIQNPIGPKKAQHNDASEAEASSGKSSSSAISH